MKVLTKVWKREWDVEWGQKFLGELDLGIIDGEYIRNWDEAIGRRFLEMEFFSGVGGYLVSFIGFLARVYKAVGCRVNYDYSR